MNLLWCFLEIISPLDGDLNGRKYVDDWIDAVFVVDY
jgi:hypothetical protein